MRYLAKIPIYKMYIFLIAIVFFVYWLGGWTIHKYPTGGSLEAPSWHHLLGTDDLGIDILGQLCYGGGYSLILGSLTGLITVIIGVFIGFVSGYYGGKMDRLLMGMSDLILSMPQMIVLIVVGAFFEASYQILVVIIALISWPPISRMIRAKIIFLKEKHYIQRSKNYGGSILYLFQKHFWPMIQPLITLAFIKMVSKTIVMEASLAYLGISDPTSKSWGLMLNRASGFSGIFFTSYWKWWVLAPLIAFVSLIVALMFWAKEYENGDLLKRKERRPYDIKSRKSVCEL